MLWIQRFALRCSDPKRPQPQHAHTPSRDQIRCFVNFSILRHFSESSLWYTEVVVHTDVPHFFPQHLFFHWSPVFTATAPQSSVRVQCKRCWMLETSRSLVHSQPGVNAKPQNKRMANEGSVAWSETVQPISNRRTQNAPKLPRRKLANKSSAFKNHRVLGSGHHAYPKKTNISSIPQFELTTLNQAQALCHRLLNRPPTYLFTPMAHSAGASN